MLFKKTHHWVETFLWIGVVLVLIGLGFTLWRGCIYGAIACAVILAVLLLFLGYCKYMEMLAIRRKFVVLQESFTTLMLVYFSYVYFTGSKKLPGEKALTDAREKFDAVYEDSRKHISLPIVETALKTFGEIKNIKNIIMDEAKSFSSSDGFNLDNAENMTKEIGNLIQKLTQLSDMISKAFSSKKSLEDIADSDSETDEKTENSRAAQNKSRSKTTRKKTSSK